MADKLRDAIIQYLTRPKMEIRVGLQTWHPVWLDYLRELGLPNAARLVLQRWASIMIDSPSHRAPEALQGFRAWGSVDALHRAKVRELFRRAKVPHEEMAMKAESGRMRTALFVFGTRITSLGRTDGSRAHMAMVARDDRALPLMSFVGDDHHPRWHARTTLNEAEQLGLATVWRRNAYTWNGKRRPISPGHWVYLPVENATRDWVFDTDCKVLGTTGEWS